jgi:miniconductance mechanosensitive channel
MTWLKTITDWLNANPNLKQVVVLSGILVLSYLSYIITKKVVLKWIQKLVKKSKNKLDDIIFDKFVSRRFAFIPPILIINTFSYLLPSLQMAISRICLALLFWIILLTVSSSLNGINKVYEKKKEYKGRPIKGYIQIVIIAMYIVGILALIGILTGQSPLVLLSGIGALTAVILLIFRDTILSFVASLQITSNDLVRLKDWIEVPKFGADGDVIDIALHTIKIQNFDKTITVIPTHKLIDESFKNWRGMQECGGRRIKRSIFIDISSITFCDDKMMEYFDKIILLKEYIKKKRKEIDDYNKKHNIDLSNKVNGRRMTNMGMFRAYIEAYLRNHSKINKELTFLIRQMKPGPTGLPIEIYVFSTTTDWVVHESIQSDIFDHLFAIVKEFNLRLFQYPGGKDFERLPIPR